MFSCEFCDIFQNTFLTEHLWTTGSGVSFDDLIITLVWIFPSTKNYHDVFLLKILQGGSNIYRTTLWFSQNAMKLRWFNFLHSSEMNFKVEGSCSTEKVSPATTVGRQGKFLNSRRSRMAWWQTFNSFCFETLSFFSFPFFSLLSKKWRGGMPHPNHVLCHVTGPVL